MKAIFFIWCIAGSLIINAQDVNNKKTDILLKLLNDVNKPTGKVNLLFQYDREHFNDPRITSRLLEIVSNERTEAEINSWVALEIDKEFYTESREKDALREVKRNDEDFKKVLDSLKQVQIDLLSKRFKDSKVLDEVLVLVGMIDLQESVPILKSALNKPKQYNIELVKLVLARFLVEPYTSDCIKKYSSKKPINKCNVYTYDPICDYQYKATKLLFIATKESVLQVADWLSRKELVSPESDERVFPIGIYAVRDLVSSIKNEELYERFTFEWRSTALVTSITNDDVVFLREWINKNKKRIEIGRELSNALDYVYKGY